MSDTVITLCQLFGIGFSFALYGPCLISCMPALIYFIAKDNKPKNIIFRLIIFLTGRILSYVVLGFFAGISAKYLNRFVAISFFKPILGILIIGLGIVLLLKKTSLSCCVKKVDKKSSVGLVALFFTGCLVGISPCPPLMAILLEIVIMSKNALDGMMYSFAFGLGTFVSGFLLFGVVSNLFGVVSRKILSDRYLFLSKIICAGLLILFGCWILIASLIGVHSL